MRNQESCVSCRTEAELKRKRKSDKYDMLVYQHKELVKRLQRKFDLSDVDAKILFQELLNFLWKCGTTKKSCRPPSTQVDEAWHQFILYTRDYAAFCQKYFGHFIHHQPDPEKRKFTSSSHHHDGVACRTHGNLS